MGLFGRKTSGARTRPEAGRVQRHSSGWAQIGVHLRSHDSLRMLDFGPTSAGNINFVTSLGHSIYMSNLVEDAARFEHRITVPATTPSTQPPAQGLLDVSRFLDQNLNFAGRTFDVVTLWDTFDYVPKELTEPVVARLFEVMEPGGKLLAFFHPKTTGEDTDFSRFHMTESDQVDRQRIGTLPLLNTYTNRQVETLFKSFAGSKFFLAKDNLREVIVSR